MFICYPHFEKGVLLNHLVDDSGLGLEYMPVGFFFSAIEKKKVYLYEMQIRPWNSRKNNSLAAYMDLTHTVSMRF